MGIEEKRLSNRALRTPGQEDRSPWPPVGQLEFDKITAMDEEALDYAFKERHGLKEVLKPQKANYQQHYSAENVDARRLELKRIALARLEGIGLGPTSQIWDWYDSMKKDAEDPVSSLRVILKNFLTDECKSRISDVREKVAREAAVLAPYSRLQKLEREIQAKLRRMGQQPLSINEIFKAERLPSHAGEGLQSTRLNLETGLKLYLLKLEGLSNAECAQRLKTTKGTAESFWMIYFTEHAREICRAARGIKPRYERGTE
ncbi:hypothetical protein A3A39_01860 [Candidatus Kaiserbacteria bacterium RIFCSPLOWO2_01_FULL_54_13]|uniref:Uncharacterized protein n=1 Tax=Candidatus Kaiserbacteria bacterium RIFCSPLOWO2_01_FULL_54_13 TaxID=1798512 RepID=A0A1F6F091_9BACT|nr:MAG: hypothetical protein A3A39_01860 [Candidatus Kaiserbacteria bacterium RIFCSPLOWO2_01_FULL_54_13]